MPSAPPSRRALRPTRRVPDLLGLGLILLTLLPAGCSEELGPERFETVPIRGRVVVFGAPVRSGWIEFRPGVGTRGNLESARIGPDGTFLAEQVAVGEVHVRLVHPDRAMPGGYLFVSHRSPLRLTVPDRPLDDWTLDLGLEYRRLAGGAERTVPKPGEAKVSQP